MNNRRNFFKVLSRLYLLPAMSANALLQSCSYNKLEIKLPKLTLLPFSSSVYEGEAFFLQWNAENIETIILKVIAVNGSSAYQTSVMAVMGIQSFKVTDFISNGEYKIHLSKKGDESVFSESEFFTIYPSRKPILAINPIQAPVYENEPFTITWNSVNSIQIHLLIMNEVSEIIFNTTVNADLKKQEVIIPKAGRFTIKLINTEDQNISSETHMFDVLSRQTDLVIKSPNGGETFSVLKTISIEWESNKSSSINLYYSYNGGFSWLNIVAGINTSAASYQWTLPDISSENYLIKIEDAQNKTIFDSSNNPFQVIARYEINLDLHPELAAIGGFRVFESNALGSYTLVRISETSFKAYSHICTHNGCTITLETRKAYRCSCHGSEFDFEGNVTNGPAMRPLDLFAVIFDSTENVVVITK